MPDFNFAKGSGRREQDSPRRRGSVLDKYPARDLSHLEEGSREESSSAASTGPAAAAAAASPSDSAQQTSGEAADNAAKPATTQSNASVPADPDTTGGGHSGDLPHGEGPGKAGTADSPAAPHPSSKWPLIALIAVVLFLIIIAFIWHINPWPSLKESISDVFQSEETVQPQMPASDAAHEAMDEEEAIPVRSWDYFVQVSSWKDLGKADLDAERYRAQGLDVIVESEYIPAKRGTFYRVRLGPYASSDEARQVQKDNMSALPAGTFIDSTRLTDDEFMPPEEQTTEARPAAAPRHNAGRGREAIPGGAEFDMMDQPLSGWAVKVSSFKESDIARSEARRLLAQGYPSFITRKHIGGTTWYRVLVGPFSDKHDADRYMELLNVTHGNEAYTVNLANY